MNYQKIDINMESIWDLYDLGLTPFEYSKIDINVESVWNVFVIDLGLIPYP